MRNIRLTVAYDGTGYHGFQRQEESHGLTIQGTLESVWRDLVREKISSIPAGRTDSGVHAKGQVVSFKTEARIPVEKIPKAFNSLLPRDIRIVDSQCVPADFNARWSAKWKRYDYFIDNHRIPDVFTRLYAYHVPIPLDIIKMREASQQLEGYHNFKTFAASGGSSKRYERNLYHCQVKQQGSLLRISCVGDGFLYHMVRIIVGTLTDVGKGRIDPAEIPEIIASQDRVRASVIAPAHGLVLQHVHYGDEKPSDVFEDLLLDI